MFINYHSIAATCYNAMSINVGYPHKSNIETCNPHKLDNFISSRHPQLTMYNTELSININMQQTAISACNTTSSTYYQQNSPTAQVALFVTCQGSSRNIYTSYLQHTCYKWPEPARTNARTISNAIGRNATDTDKVNYSESNHYYVLLATRLIETESDL